VRDCLLHLLQLLLELLQLGCDILVGLPGRLTLIQISTSLRTALSSPLASPVLLPLEFAATTPSRTAI
jgi:hypothetical protein